jgi:hypothetical protein
MVQGTQGEDRFVLTLNGKFLPHVEQLLENNTTITNSSTSGNIDVVQRGNKNT